MVAARPNWPLARMIGVINAKLDARNTGTCRPVTTEQQRAQASGKQCDVWIKTCDQRHQHQRAKCYEEHLCARQDLAPKRVVEIILHAHASFCLVPKILSPASPRPGMM